MNSTFESKVWSGNNRDTGFVPIRKDLASNFKSESNFKITIVSGKKSETFFGKTKVMKNRAGFYVPAKIVRRENLKGRKISIKTEKIAGFSVCTGKDGRFYIPKNISDELGLENQEIILVKFSKNNKQVFKHAKVNRRVRANTIEQYAMLGSDLSEEKFILNIEKTEKYVYNNDQYLDFNLVLPDSQISALNNRNAIFFKGKIVPIKFNYQIKPKELAHYIGCFYADGTKLGNSWAICASNFLQAKYYAKMHENIFLESNPEITLSITVNKENKNKVDKIEKIWKEKGIKINKVRKIKSKGKIINKKMNEFGTLIMREHLQGLLLLYNGLKDQIIENIVKDKNKEMAIDFICGVLEGDGSVNPNGYLRIHTNKNEINNLKKVLAASGIGFSAEKSKKNDATIRINTIEIIKNFEMLAPKVFKYYPKRRKMLIERLFNRGLVRFIAGKQKHAVAFVKKELKEAGILDESYKLTKKGKRIRKLLLNMEKSVTVK